MRDSLDGLDPFTDSANRHIAIAEHATENGLIHVYALDLVKVHFEGPAFDETFLVHNSQAGHVGLGGPAVEPRLESPLDGYETGNHRKCQPEHLGAAATGTPLHDP